MNMRDLDLRIMFDSMFYKCKTEEEADDLWQHLCDLAEYSRDEFVDTLEEE